MTSPRAGAQPLSRVAQSVIAEMLTTPHNITVLLDEAPTPQDQSDSDEYDRLMTDIWVGAVLTLMIFSCICCVCSCLLYHKFQQWKRRVMESRTHSTERPENDQESLPSYTIVSGLPSYDEALEQLRKARESPAIKIPLESDQQVKLSVTDLFNMYKTYPPPT